jgi:aquaporin related protein
MATTVPADPSGRAPQHAIGDEEEDSQALLRRPVGNPTSTPPQANPTTAPAHSMTPSKRPGLEDEPDASVRRSEDWQYRRPPGAYSVPPGGYAAPSYGPYSSIPPWERDREQRKWDRHSDWYPEYRGPERYLDWDPASRDIRRGASLREPGVGSTYGRVPGRRSFDDEGLSTAGPPPPASHGLRRREKERRRNWDSDDEYDDEYRTRKPARRYRDDFDGEGGRRPPAPPTDRESFEEPHRLPWTKWMGSKAKGHTVAAVGEFVGTTMFLFFAFAGTQVANVGSRTADSTTTGQETGFRPDVLLYIALCFGFSLMVNVWVFFRISGGLFNPAVSANISACQIRGTADKKL